MALDDLFDEEDAMITMATDIVNSSAYSDNPLFQHFSKLLVSYAKLNKQQKRIIRLSDKQHLKLSAINKEMKHILDNIPLGIVIIARDGTVIPSYSRHMHKLFRLEKKMAGSPIDRILYWEDHQEKERETLKKWFDLVFDLSYDWDLVGGLGPDVIQHESDGGSLYYKHSFHRIIHDNGELYLMVYITDITEEIRQKNALKEQEAAHNFELEIFSCVVNQESNSDIVDYINETERMLSKGAALFKSIVETKDKAPLYNHMFRLMHSIKGLSRTYGMNEMGRLAHLAEDILDKYRSNEISFETGVFEGALASDTLSELLEKMGKLIANGVKILHKVFSQGKENAAAIRSRRRGIKIDEEKIQTLISYAETLKDDAAMGRDYLSKKISGLVDNLFSLSLQPLDVAYNRFQQIVNDVSKSLGKKARLVIDGEPLFLGPQAHHQMINSMIHLLRNSIDHGIETPELRSELGKDPEGRIRIETSMNQGLFRVEIGDDGGGIDPEIIAKQAVAKGFASEDSLMSMTDQEKIELILLPGFSSKESVSDISGRGVGLDVVAETMRSLGGKLFIESELDSGTTLILEFPSPKNELAVNRGPC